MTFPDPLLLPLPAGLCRRCVRSLSRRVADVPGVSWFEVDAAAGLLRVTGDVDPAAVAAVVSERRRA
jgi:hypothetical protein